MDSNVFSLYIPNFEVYCKATNHSAFIGNDFRSLDKNSWRTLINVNFVFAFSKWSTATQLSRLIRKEETNKYSDFIVSDSDKKVLSRSPQFTCRRPLCFAAIHREAD